LGHNSPTTIPIEKVHNILAVPSHLYGYEIWTLIQRDTRRLKTAEIKCMRRIAGYSLLDHRRNENILEELYVDPVEKKLAKYI
jgi:hypothetical protein